MALNAEQIGQMSRLLDQALPLALPARQTWLDELPPEYSQLVLALRQALLGGLDEGAGLSRG